MRRGVGVFFREPRVIDSAAASPFLTRNSVIVDVEAWRFFFFFFFFHFFFFFFFFFYLVARSVGIQYQH